MAEAPSIAVQHLGWEDLTTVDRPLWLKIQNLFELKFTFRCKLMTWEWFSWFGLTVWEWRLVEKIFQKHRTAARHCQVCSAGDLACITHADWLLHSLKLVLKRDSDSCQVSMNRVNQSVTRNWNHHICLSVPTCKSGSVLLLLIDQAVYLLWLLDQQQAEELWLLGLFRLKHSESLATVLDWTFVAC